jgi:beta-N-acetylhexosaminidase
MVLVCNQPEAAEVVLNELSARPSPESVRRIKRMRARGKALKWDKLIAQPEYLQARGLLTSVLA